MGESSWGKQGDSASFAAQTRGMGGVFAKQNGRRRKGRTICTLCGAVAFPHPVSDAHSVAIECYGAQIHPVRDGPGGACWGGLEMFGLFRRVFASRIVGAAVEVAVLAGAWNQGTSAFWAATLIYGTLVLVFGELNLLNMLLAFLTSTLRQFA